MAFIVEDGTGVSGANSYVEVSFVNDYLSERNRASENSWNTLSSAAKQANIIAATDYIEQRWGQRFLGNKKFKDISAARATLTFTGQPADGETVTIGSTTYTYNTVLGGANSVLIGANTDASIKNLVDAVLATESALGDTVGSGTTANADATAEEEIGDRMVAEAKEKGTPGNDVVTTTTVANASWSSSTLVGGGDVQVPQPLAFPRRNLFDRDGIEVSGIPTKLKQATAEYAVRAASSTLSPDPTIDESGKATVRNREKVGPIEEERQFEEGGSSSYILRPYPAADRLLLDYIASAGRVIRG